MSNLLESTKSAVDSYVCRKKVDLYEVNVFDLIVSFNLTKLQQLGTPG